jgi:polyhydroxybutyrate depolymerase
MRKAVLVVAFVSACSSSSASLSPGKDAGAADSGLADAGVRGGYDPVPFGGSRPVKLYVPSGYDPSVPAPLLILLHGYGANGGEEELYLDLHPTADAKGVLYAHPDGTVDDAGNQFWNATDGCCNFYGSTVDDSSYLAGLVAEIGTRYSVDPKRVFFFGHSNGAFMAYRMACDHADIIAGIGSLAGATWEDTTKCTPSEAVTLVEIHGTADVEILYGGYDGGVEGGTGAYPSAPESVADWAAYDGCNTPADTTAPGLDLMSPDGGVDTTVARYAAGCRSGTEADLWTIPDAGHIPEIGPGFASAVFDYLLAHPKP